MHLPSPFVSLGKSTGQSLRWTSLRTTAIVALAFSSRNHSFSAGLSFSRLALVSALPFGKKSFQHQRSAVVNAKQHFSTRNSSSKLSVAAENTESIGEANTAMNEFVALEDSAWFREPVLRTEALEKCLMPLSPTSYKGSSGRVGILGGSARYTGAPYYAGMASLKVGADLAFVFCAEEASIPIKTYSPELMVAPVYSAKEFDNLVKGKRLESEEAELLVQDMVEQVDELLDKLHALVIGPGLGRCPLVMRATSKIIEKARSIDLPLVLDADALFLLTMPEYRGVLVPLSSEPTTEGGAAPVILTPNAMERKRLEALGEDWQAMRSLPGIVVVEKGAHDVIYHSLGRTHNEKGDPTETGDVPALKCLEPGGWKRSGGLGDILAGTLGTLVAWNALLTKEGASSPDKLPLSCWTACSFVKRSTHVAFHDHHRAMTAPDVLDALGPTIRDMTTKEG